LEAWPEARYSACMIRLSKQPVQEVAMPRQRSTVPHQPEESSGGSRTRGALETNRLIADFMKISSQVEKHLHHKKPTFNTKAL
jgi:hypothetical protein